MADSLLVIESLSFKYRTRSELAIEDISFQLLPGELLLIAGSSGCGKTTLARCINGLIPRSYRGERSGSVRLNGKEVAQMPIAEVAQVTGTLLQDPERQIVASNVYNEVAFGPENLGLPRREILERVDKAANRLKIGHLLDRQTFNLSGGEKQKVALAGLLAMNPSILLLDEPLASLDPASAYEALDIFRSLADEGKTIILIEHRVEDALASKPDRMLYMEKGRIVYLDTIEKLPPIIDPHEVKLPAQWVVEHAKAGSIQMSVPQQHTPRETGKPLVVFDHVDFRYNEDLPLVLQDVNLEIYPGDLIGMIGPNAAGKSTLVKHIIGLLKPTRGSVKIDEHDTLKISVAQIARQIGYVFQSPTHMLYAPTVREELEFGPVNLGFSPGEKKDSVGKSLVTLNLTGLEEYPPLGLSFGQQKRTTIAAVLAMRSRILIMDEPTAGQDYANYTHFMDALCGAEDGEDSILTTNFAATLFITHDLDLAITYANRILLIGDQHIVADGKPEEVLQDLDQLLKYRVRPTSLLRLNLDLLGKTGRFMRAEALSNFI